jgi:hypothetical protein
MLTGFDAKKVNTLYVDKGTTRLNTGVFKDESNIGWAESQGNILSFRNLKATDRTITLCFRIKRHWSRYHARLWSDSGRVWRKLLEKCTLPKYLKEKQTFVQDWCRARRGTIHTLILLGRFTYWWAKFRRLQSKYLDIRKSKTRLEKAKTSYSMILILN